MLIFCIFFSHSYGSIIKKMRVKVNVNMNMEGSGIRICIYKSIFGIFAKYKEDIGE